MPKSTKSSVEDVNYDRIDEKLDIEGYSEVSSEFHLNFFSQPY